MHLDIMEGMETKDMATLKDIVMDTETLAMIALVVPRAEVNENIPTVAGIMVWATAFKVETTTVR